MNSNNNLPMLNAYPDSIGGNLSSILKALKTDELKGCFSSFYILPSIFNSDLDRGFSVVDYNLNNAYASLEDLSELKSMNIDLKLDFVLNHASVLSKEFQDIIKNGENSKYRDFFINWNDFWADHGEMTDEGYIQPDKKYLEKMFFRKAGLPILMVYMPDGTKLPYWNTFYQEIKYPKLDAQDIMELLGMQYTQAGILATKINSVIPDIKEVQNILSEIKSGDKVFEYLEKNRRYLGQMDLNIKSKLVWEFYEETIKKLAEYGAGIVRLDAFAYAPKEVGEKNFLNDPGTWDLLKRIRELADRYGLSLLPEIHASYEEKIYKTISDKGYMTYDFFLPGLVIDAIENKSGKYLVDWANELYGEKIRAVNMLGCHDGIPLLDLKGILSEERIQNLIDIIVKRGGYVKNLHGQKNIYYQVNATFYSALGENDKKFLLSRAIQIFMPGKPQVWYLDLFAGKNDYEAMRLAGEGGHKEINRTNLSLADVEENLKRNVVKEQLKLLRFRNECKAFGFDSELNIVNEGNVVKFTWSKNGQEAILEVDFNDLSAKIIGKSKAEVIFNMEII